MTRISIQLKPIPAEIGQKFYTSGSECKKLCHLKKFYWHTLNYILFTLKNYSMNSNKLLVFLALSFTSASGIGQTGTLACGSLENGYGPFDYRGTDARGRAIVEKFHFTSKVETLQGGSTASTPGGDLAYTLRVFPNHPRALMATIKFSERTKKNPPPEMVYTVHCWLDRAERFKPDDATVKMLFGIYLIRSGKAREAIPKLEAALELSDNDANTLYNLGLAYFDLKEFDKSLELAHRAYSQGFPLPGLRDKLRRAGKWKDAS